MILMTDVFLENYVSIYFLAIAVKTHYKSDSYLWKFGCMLLSLMNERAEPLVDITDNIHYYIELFTTNNANERGCNKRNNAISLETSPTFYTMLLFFQAFCKYAFNHHFAFMKCNNPYFGSETYGQLACFMPECIYLMKREVSTLRGEDGNGWKGINLFAPYLKALSNVPKKSIHLADRSFFEKLPIKFINEYHSNLNKHLIDHWRLDDLVLYILGGQPELAREFARMIIHYDSISRATEDKNNEFQGYCFPNAEIVMDVFHNTGMETEDHVSISVSECMTFLTNKSDLYKICNDPFIRANWDSIVMLTLSDDIAVHLSDKLDDSLGDTSSWGYHDYGSLLDNIWMMIAIHSHHQQRCENFVQMSALISKTKVKEARRKQWAIAILLVIRRFNQLSLDQLQEDEPDPIKRAWLQRVRGSAQTEWLSDYTDLIFQQVAEARDKLGTVKCDAVLNSIRSGLTKVSAKERMALVASFERSVKKDTALRKYAAETVSGYTATVLMDRKIVISAMTKKANCEGSLNLEIIARKIPLEMPEFISECGSNMCLDQVSIKQKQYFLRLDEARCSMKDNPFLNETDAIKAASAFTPISSECQQLLAQDNAVENNL
jgi:hypothetical protein